VDVPAFVVDVVKQVAPFLIRPNQGHGWQADAGTQQQSEQEQGQSSSGTGTEQQSDRVQGHPISVRQQQRPTQHITDEQLYAMADKEGMGELAAERKMRLTDAQVKCNNSRDSLEAACQLLASTQESMYQRKQEELKFSRSPPSCPRQCLTIHEWMLLMQDAEQMCNSAQQDVIRNQVWLDQCLQLNCRLDMAPRVLAHTSFCALARSLWALEALLRPCVVIGRARQAFPQVWLV